MWCACVLDEEGQQQGQKLGENACAKTLPNNLSLREACAQSFLAGAPAAGAPTTPSAHTPPQRASPLTRTPIAAPTAGLNSWPRCAQSACSSCWPPPRRRRRPVDGLANRESGVDGGVCVCVGNSGCSAATPHTNTTPDSVRLIKPVPGTTTLAVDDAGLTFLRSLPAGVSVAPVVVIGPYRSGKSFLLNNALLRVGCDAGFGVGHSRAAETKGMWVWGDPHVGEDGGQILHIDAEGFDASGLADSYDDRIFALASVVSSVLIYNLPEAVRESDIEKLGFSIQVADALFPSTHGATTTEAVRPGAMLWLIQRDFLGGDTPQAALDAALAPVPNPKGDAAINRLNTVRSALARLASTSTALGLPQPHLDRTRLCELGDGELAPTYLTARDRVATTVTSLATPKVVRGAPLDGPALADLVASLVDALNSRDIPSAGSILEAFNRDAARRAVDAHATALARVTLPVNASTLDAAHTAAKAAAIAAFEAERFGGAGPAADAERAALQTDLDAAASAARDRNELASSRACASLATAVEDALDAEARSALPSAARFEARRAATRAAFDAGCVGPAASDAAARLDRVSTREAERFGSAYNDRLFGGLVYASIAFIALARFVARSGLLELLAWASASFLQLYPKGRAFGGASLYEARWWHAVVAAWEAFVRYPPVPVALAAALALLLLARLRSRFRGWRARRRDRGGRSDKSSPSRRGGAAAWVLGGGAASRRRGRDLDV